MYVSIYIGTKYNLFCNKTLDIPVYASYSISLLNESHCYSWKRYLVFTNLSGQMKLGLNIEETPRRRIICFPNPSFGPRMEKLSCHIRSCSCTRSAAGLLSPHRAGRPRQAGKLTPGKQTSNPGTWRRESHLPNLHTRLLSSLKVGLKTRLATSRYIFSTSLIVIKWINFFCTSYCGPALI